MNKTLYLHVGIHKTGTSSIQRTLFSNRVLLENEGYFYPKGWNENHSGALQGMFSDDPCSTVVNIKKCLTREQIFAKDELNKNIIINEVQNTSCNNIIISAEGTSLFPKDELVIFKNFINERLDITEIVVILSVRDVLSFAMSTIQENVKSGNKGYGLNVERFNLLYETKISKFIDIFGRDNLKIYKFEDAIKHKYGPVAYFLE